MAAMKENTRKIFDYLKAHNGDPITNQDVADATGVSVKGVVGSFNSFVKKGWGVRTEAEVENADGTHATVKLLALTDVAMAIDPDAEADAQ